MMYLRCTSCGTDHSPTTQFRCRECDGLLAAEYDNTLMAERIEAGEGLFEKYGSRLPSNGSVAGDEGGTPLLRADAVGLETTVYLKDERRNPTGSFKDRALAPAVSLAAESGFEAVITASTGNAAAACARYAARGGLDCYVLVEESAPPKKLLEPRVYGAEVVRVPELFAGGEDALASLLDAVADELEAYMAFAYQPFNAILAEGVKTISYEVAERLGFDVPDVVVTATGGGDNLAAQYRGYRELRDAGLTTQVPRMVGAQAAGAAPLAAAIEGDDPSPVEIDDPATIASGISAPFAGQHALDAIRESDGTAIGVEDDKLIEAVMSMAETTSIWPEPASATVLPALTHLIDRGEVGSDDVVLLTVTGSGHKHPEPVEARFGDVFTADRDPTAIAKAFANDQSH